MPLDGLRFELSMVFSMQSHTGFSAPLAGPQLCLFSHREKSTAEASRVSPVKAPCRPSEKLLSVLEEITGWKAEFAETASSFRNRNQEGMENEPAQGSFSIVDMSADWPARQPTAHRGKCDELVGLISDLVGELQTAKLELSRLRNVMAVLPSESKFEREVEIWVDSFVPKFGRVAAGNADSDFQGTDSPDYGSDSFDDFEVFQELTQTESKLVSPPFDGWSLGGTTGIVDDTYLDWLVDPQERIAISVGKIESAHGDGDRQTVLKVEPLTSEFRVAAQGDISAFYHLDSAASEFQKLSPSTNWTRLGVGDAIIASTNESLNLDAVLAEVGAAGAVQLDADSLAQAVTQANGDSDRTLVLKRG